MDERSELMKVKYIGKSDPLSFINGKVYDKIGESHGLWRIVDETGEDYLFDPRVFEIVDSNEDQQHFRNY